jgi:hypothetical protein
MLRSRAPIHVLNGEEQLTLLLDALSSESMKLLDYLEEEYFEDITEDPRFEKLNDILSLYMLLKREPSNPNLARFFAELDAERRNGSSNGNGKT